MTSTVHDKDLLLLQLLLLLLLQWEGLRHDVNHMRDKVLISSVMFSYLV